MKSVIYPLAAIAAAICLAACSNPESSSSSSSSSSLSAPSVTGIISTPGYSDDGTSCTTASVSCASASSTSSTDGQITWAWPAESGAASYNLYYAEGSTVTTSDGTEIKDITTACTSSSGSGCPSGDSYATVTGLKDNTEYAFILTAVDSSGSESSASSVFTDTPPYFGSDVPDSPGTASSDAAVIDSDVPSWIRNGFTNVRAYLDGSDVVIDTRDLPPYTSYYYRTATGATDSDTDTATTPAYPDPNIIEEQAIRIVVPESPSYSSTTTNEWGLGIVGLSANGLAIFNAEANINGGDYISDEGYSFDADSGHPQGDGVYHYHTQPVALTPSSGYDDELLGVGLDGFPIYGPQNASGSEVANYGGTSAGAITPSITQTGACTDIDFPNWESDSTDPTASALPHYRVVSNFWEYTHNYKVSGSTVATELEYLLGCYRDGSALGTQTNYAYWDSATAGVLK